jgi:hypothetical protein
MKHKVKMVGKQLGLSVPLEVNLSVGKTGRLHIRSKSDGTISHGIR